MKANIDNWKKNNVEQVLSEVNLLLEVLEEKKANARFRWEKRPTFLMKEVYERLSIFDWWVNELNTTRLKDMKMFLSKALELGLKGYCCFKVGVDGCANGMWVHSAESTDGYSPDNCIVLYKSFTPSYNYWSIDLNNGKGFIPGKEKHSSCKTFKQLKELIKENGGL